MNHSIAFTGDWALHGIMSDLGVDFALSPFHRIGLEIDEEGIQKLSERYPERVFTARQWSDHEKLNWTTLLLRFDENTFVVAHGEGQNFAEIMRCFDLLDRPAAARIAAERGLQFAPNERVKTGHSRGSAKPRRGQTQGGETKDRLREITLERRPCRPLPSGPRPGTGAATLKNMNTNDLIQLGIPAGDALKLAHSHLRRLFARGLDRAQVEAEFSRIITEPAQFFGDPDAGELARSLSKPHFTPRAQPAPWRQWGADLEAQAVQQMANACALPVAVAGALMPDAHVGYGLPIGGVLATENAVIPYAVGVDIACRMRLSVFDLKANTLAGQKDRLTNIIKDETRFGVGCIFQRRREHEVMDEDWSVSPVTKRLRDKAWAQLGTSGSGNHFVEFGAFTASDDSLGMPPGAFLALLTHSGSRGAGAQVCQHYSRLAMERHSELPKELKHLAWLSLEEEAGQEYWAAMNLMGQYAAANHLLIHRHIARSLGEKAVLEIENHHNFAWKERHFVAGAEREVIVHRKGATPAGPGVLGVIPGSMASPGFVVRGKGRDEALRSASHGAGRVMSRTKALQSFTWSAVKKLLAEREVTLISAGLDEVPGVYKDIATVMAAQTDLVDVLGRFDPKLVKMCPAGERAED